MRYVEATTPWKREGRGRGLFLAGGISDCPDWQMEMVKLLSDTNLVLLNPRRKDFPIDDPNAAREQIKWEFEHLREADYILFWFPYETLCPIVLFELGAWSRTGKPIFVGAHPVYKRRQDVEIQMSLVRPSMPIMYSVEGLAGQVREYVGQ